MRFVRANRAVVKELKDGIEASVAIAGGSNDLVASTNDRNPDTILSLVITITVRSTSKDRVILQAIWKRATLDKPSVFTLSMSAWSSLKEISMEIASRIVGIGSSDKDVVGLAILDSESGIDTSLTSLGSNVGNAAHLVTIVVDLDLGIKHVEVVASGNSDGLLLTIVSVAVPATTTLGLGTIAALIARFDASSVADENIRDAVNFFSEPALGVGSFLIRHDCKREGHTLDGRRNRGNGNEVGVACGKEDNLSTKATVIIVVSNAGMTRARVSG